MGSKSQPQQTTGTTTQQTLSSPSLEAALSLYTPQLMGMLSGTIDTSKFAPQVASQTGLQGQAIKSALAGQGFDYDIGTGAVTGSGIGAYQPFLDAAGTAAGQIQGAGAGALGQAQSALDQQQALAQGLSASGAASPFMQKASGAVDAAQLAALAGQGAGTADFQAARDLTGPKAYEQFMSPYQQEVIDASMAAFQKQAQEQTAKLGASAGSAFGGGRFGVAQGQLAADQALGAGQLQAGLLSQGFQQANQLAAQAQQQKMGLGQAELGQAAQNVGLLSQAGQMQSGLGTQAAQLATGDMQGLAAVAQGQGALAQSQMSPFQQALQANMQVAQAIPQFGAQQFGILSSFGDQQQQYAQAGLDAISQTNKLAQYAPYEQMGFVGSQLAGLIGGYPGGTTIGSTTAPGPTGTQSALGAGLVGSGILANLGGLFGYGVPS
jgi:hypothetical protein